MMHQTGGGIASGYAGETAADVMPSALTDRLSRLIDGLRGSTKTLSAVGDTILGSSPEVGVSLNSVPQSSSVVALLDTVEQEFAQVQYAVSRIDTIR